MLKRQLRESETRGLPGARDRPLRPLGPGRGPGMGVPGGAPMSPRGFDGSRRFDGPSISPSDGDRKHGPPREIMGRYDKRMRG